MLSGKALRKNNTLLYPSLSDEMFSLDRKNIKKKVGEILQVVLCVGRLNATAKYFYFSLDFALLLLKKNDQRVKQVRGTKHLISTLVYL